MKKLFVKIVVLLAGMSVITSPAFATKKENVLRRQSMAKVPRKRENRENQKLLVDLSGHLNQVGLPPLQALPYSQSYLLSAKPEEERLRNQILQSEATTEAEKVAEDFNAHLEEFSTHESEVSQVITLKDGRLVLKDANTQSPILLKRLIMSDSPFENFFLALKVKNWRAAAITGVPALGPLMKAVGQIGFPYSSKACGLVADALEFGRPGTMRKAASLLISFLGTAAIPAILHYGVPAIGTSS